MTLESIPICANNDHPAEAGSPAPQKMGGAPALHRREHDLLGQMDVPSDVYWGIHTLRAIQNFPISGATIGQLTELVRAIVLVKQAAARANRKLGRLPSDKAEAIEAACVSIAENDRFHDQFIVDPIQGGAGTSTNMNANEVIANVALVLSGRERGDYSVIHPNDHVNMAQSTNDAYATALRLAVIFATEPLLRALQELAYAFKAKAVEFSDVLKIGRTQLQDAVPMTLGQEFGAYSATVREDIARLRETVALFREVNLGGTAIGTGITADVRYSGLAIEELSCLSNQTLAPASDLIEATSDMGAFVMFSGVLKRVAVKLSKICNDLRLLSSGPRAGLAEIRLPAVQAGSSIMPGKINPVIPEMINQVAYIVIGNDLTVSLCAESGQLQLNAFEPTIGYCLLTSLRQLAAAVTTLTTRCVNGIQADRQRCRDLLESSTGLATALVPVLGYEQASKIAKRALGENKTIPELVIEEGLMGRAQLGDLLKVGAVT